MMVDINVMRHIRVCGDRLCESLLSLAQTSRATKGISYK